MHLPKILNNHPCVIHGANPPIISQRLGNKHGHRTKALQVKKIKSKLFKAPCITTTGKVDTYIFFPSLQ